MPFDPFFYVQEDEHNETSAADWLTAMQQRLRQTEAAKFVEQARPITETIRESLRGAQEQAGIGMDAASSFLQRGREALTSAPERPGYSDPLASGVEAPPEETESLLARYAQRLRPAGATGEATAMPGNRGAQSELRETPPGFIPEDSQREEIPTIPTLGVGPTPWGPDEANEDGALNVPPVGNAAAEPGLGDQSPLSKYASRLGELPGKFVGEMTEGVSRLTGIGASQEEKDENNRRLKERLAGVPKMEDVLGPTALQAAQDVTGVTPALGGIKVGVRAFGAASEPFAKSISPQVVKEFQAFQSLPDRIVRQLFDDTVGLRKIAEKVANERGGMQIGEDAWKLLRLSRGHAAAAEQRIEDGLAPAVKGLDEEGWDALNLLLKIEDSVDKARVIGERVTREGMKGVDAGVISSRSKRIQDKLRRDVERRPVPKNWDPDEWAAHQEARITRRGLGEAGRAQGQVSHAVTEVHEKGTTAAEQRNFGGARATEADAAREEIRQALGDERFADLERRAQQIWDYGHALLDRKVETGVVDRGLAEYLKANFPHYSPIRIVDWMEDMALKGVGSGSTRLSNPSNGLKRLTVEGTERAAEAPLDAYVRLAHETERLAMKNDAARQMLGYFRDVPELATLVRPASQEAAAALGSMRGGGIGKRVPGEEAFSIYQDGQRLDFWVDKSLHDAFNYQGWGNGGGPVVAAAKLSADILRQGATGANILFMLPNAVGDAMTYMVRNGGFLNLENWGNLARGYKEAFTKGESYKELQRLGGGQSGFFSGEVGAGAPSLRRQAGIRDGNQLTGWLKDVLTLKPARELGGRVESATRTAEFLRAKGSGADPREAALAARDVTVDFRRGGLLTKAVNSFIPFFNVGFQAPAQVVRQFQNPRTKGRAIMGLATTVAMPTAALEIYNQQDPTYQDVPDYYLNRGLVIMDPRGPGPVDPETGRPTPRFVTLATREWTPFAIATREAVRTAIGADRQGWLKAAHAMTRNVSPIEPSAQAWADFLPPSLKVSAELATGHSTFTDKPIVPEGMQHMPPEQQFLERTPETAKLIGRAFGVSPLKVEHFFTGLGAGVARQGLAASDLALQAAGVPEIEPERIQSLRREMAKTGISREEYDELRAEFDREMEMQATRGSLLREQPVVGGLASTVYREQGGAVANKARETAEERLAKVRTGQTELGAELKRTGLTFGDVRPEIAGRSLSRQQAEDYRSRSIDLREKMGAAVLASDIYKQADDTEKTAMLKRALSKATTWASQEVLPGADPDGQEYLLREINRNPDVAISGYLKAMDADRAIKQLQRQRFRGLTAEQAEQVSQDRSKIADLTMRLGEGRARVAAQALMGRARYTRARRAREDPSVQRRVKRIRAAVPEHAIFMRGAADTLVELEEAG